MTRRRLRGSVALVAAALVAGLLLTPAATAANLVTTGGPSGACIETFHGYPFVGVDPQNCPVPVQSSNSNNGMDASATLDGTDVQVTWDPPTPASDVDGYTVLRGNHPALLSAIATVEDDHTAYTDDTPATDGEFLWYQIAAIDEAGNVVAKSQITHIQPT